MKRRPYALRVSGFRFVLELPDGDVADPAMFVTAVPDWRVGDEFLAGSELQRFRTLSIHPNPDETKLEVWHAAWRVGPVERPLTL